MLKARSEAMKADIVVVNHHLFFADVMLRDEGVAELLPTCNTVIFDEAHQLPRTVISLKQGAGRLIGKHYGERIWQSLPPFRRTRELGEAVKFFG